MEFFKYFFTRMMVVGIFLLIANQLYKATYWKKDVGNHSDSLESFWELPANTENIYFGESSNFHVVDPKKGRHSISIMLDSLLKDKKIGTVDKPGLHAGTYLAVLKNIPEEMPLKMIIVTMNLRSFDADWRNSVGENYLAKTKRLIAPNLPIIPNFKYNDVIKWDSAMAWHTWLGKNPNLTEENIGLACHYIKNFAFKIDPKTNQRIKDFDEIVEIAKKRHIKIVFNLLAENMAEANKLVGKELIYLMENNRKFLINRYHRNGNLVVDNLYAIQDNHFVDRNWPTEHYTRAGKLIIAKNIQKVLISKGISKK
ncbi:MAG: hypothetical protein LW701_09460 [Fluviicola sp.]|nr:hypothetical protein [Fluviicola sp.]